MTTSWLGLLMLAVAIVNAGLMAWLWRFPMEPDPSGHHPGGVSTAPRVPRLVHRGLGYVFAMAYVALLFEMLPRTSAFGATTLTSQTHGALGGLVGVLLLAKVAVLRRYHRFAPRLPWLGGALAATTVLVVASGVVPAWIVMRPFATLTPELARGREVVSARCHQCHGASMIASERRDLREWQRVVDKMQRKTATSPGKHPISDDERLAAAAYLSHVLGAADDEPDEERGRGRRRRGR